jgi:hypothetical protein
MAEKEVNTTLPPPRYRTKLEPSKNPLTFLRWQGRN